MTECKIGGCNYVLSSWSSSYPSGHKLCHCCSNDMATWLRKMHYVTMFPCTTGEAQPCIALKHRGETIQIEPARLTISFQNGNKIRLWQTRCKHDELSCNAVLCSLKGLFGDLFRCLWKWTSAPSSKELNRSEFSPVWLQISHQWICVLSLWSKTTSGSPETANKRLNLEQPANLQGS